MNPDYAFALDTTLSGDHPGIKLLVKWVKRSCYCLIDASGRGIMILKLFVICYWWGQEKVLIIK